LGRVDDRQHGSVEARLSGQTVPLAMFAITATALLWAWTASGVLVELLRVLLPSAFGWTTVDRCWFARTLFSVTLMALSTSG